MINEEREIPGVAGSRTATTNGAKDFFENDFMSKLVLRTRLLTQTDTYRTPSCYYHCNCVHAL